MYVAEYNPKQNQFHIEKKSKKYERVLKAIARDSWKNEAEWMPFFEGTIEECSKACDKLKI